jgi:tetratricopeptide (TPR) repeat protein
MLLAGGSPPSPPAAPAPVDLSVRRPPSTADEFFARGVEFLKVNDPTSAMKDFDAALSRKPDGRTTAYLAYCKARGKEHAAAAELYKEAITDHGYKPAWVRNNRAYSLLQISQSQSRAHLPAAIAEATAALELDSTLRAARYNRAWARFLLDLHPQTRTLPTPDCLADFEVVLADGPATADLYFKAALVLTATRPKEEACLARAVGYLRDAVALGKPPGNLAQDPVLKTHLSGRPDFQAVLLLPRAAVRAESAAALSLADPLAR